MPNPLQRLDPSFECGKGDQCVYTSMLMSATPDSVLCLPATPLLIQGKKQVQTTILTYGPRSSTNSQFCFDNDFISLLFICIYFLQYLFQYLKFLFLQFLLGYLFLLCNLPFQFRNNVFFFSEDRLHVAGRAHVRVDCELQKF